MTDWRLTSMKTMVALMLSKGIEPNCEMLARTCGLESADPVRDEVARIKAKVPPNVDTGCEAK